MIFEVIWQTECPVLLAPLISSIKGSTLMIAHLKRARIRPHVAFVRKILKQLMKCVNSRATTCIFSILNALADGWLPKQNVLFVGKKLITSDSHFDFK